MINSTGWYFGLEQEFFYATDLKEGQVGQLVVLVPPMGIPRDNAGWLIEARGQPYKNPFDAVYSLKSATAKIKDKLSTGFLKEADCLKVPIRVKTECIKKYGISAKDKLVQNLYGESLTDEQLEWDYAGIHINISKIKHSNKEYTTEMFDVVPVIRFLDSFFEIDIKGSGRLRGSYSVKPLDKGIGLEYRSLSTTTSHNTIINGLKKLKEEVLL